MEQPISSSQNPVPSELNDEAKKVLGVLVNEFHTLKQEVADIKNEAILKALQLPEEDLKAAGVLSDNDARLKRGRGGRPLLESEILEAQSKTTNAHAAARYLQVHYATYKKWAKHYGIFKTNPWGKGMKKKYWAPDKGKYPLNQILEGKFPDYPTYRLKDMIIRSGIKSAECENCGFSERRITDQKMPLLIAFKDGNEKNHLLENIEILCYNCMFLIGKGFIRRGRVELNFTDPDKIQGANRKVEARF